MHRILKQYNGSPDESEKNKETNLFEELRHMYILVLLYVRICQRRLQVKKVLESRVPNFNRIH